MIQKTYYEKIDINDRSQIMEPGENYFILFENGEIYRLYDENLPFELATHWLKPITGYLLTEDEAKEYEQIKSVCTKLY